MSQTTGEPGRDPDKDEWLQQFKGLPESYEPEDLTNDRPQVDRVMKKRTYGLSIEGQIEGIGDFAEGVRDRLDSRDRRRTGSSIGILLVYGVLIITFLGVLASYIPF
jgi:hypothetical protein